MKKQLLPTRQGGQDKGTPADTIPRCCRRLPCDRRIPGRREESNQTVKRKGLAQLFRVGVQVNRRNSAEFLKLGQQSQEKVNKCDLFWRHTYCRNRGAPIAFK